MPEKDPDSLRSIFSGELWSYLWVIFISAWGGIVSYLRKVKAGETRPFNITEFIGEVVTSGFVGVLTYWVCQANGVSPYITAAMVGITGHMGSRAIFMLEQYASERILKRPPAP